MTKVLKGHQSHPIRSHFIIPFQLSALKKKKRKKPNADLISLFWILVWSELSVEMRGEEKDAEATLVHAT